MGHPIRTDKMGFVKCSVLILVLVAVANTIQAAFIAGFGLPKNATKNDLDLRAVRTVDTLISAWPIPSAIPYRLDPSYSKALFELCRTEY